MAGVNGAVNGVNGAQGREYFNGGFLVRLGNRQYLDILVQRHGEFWLGVHIRGNEFLEFFFDRLAFAMSFRGVEWSTISYVQLVRIANAVDNAISVGFVVDCLGPMNHRCKLEMTRRLLLQNINQAILTLGEAANGIIVLTDDQLEELQNRLNGFQAQIGQLTTSQPFLQANVEF